MGEAFKLSGLMRAARENAGRLKFTAEIVKNGLISLMLEGKGGESGGYIASQLTDEVSAMRLIGPDGIIRASANPSEINSIIKVSPDETRFYYSRRTGLPVSLFTPLYNGKPCQRCHGREDGTLSVLNIGLSGRENLNRLSALRTNLAVSFFASFLLLFVPFWMFYRRFVMRPLLSLSKAAGRASSGDFSVRFRDEGPGEFRTLSGGLNRAFSRFEEIRRDLETCHLDTVKKMEKMASLGELAAAVAHEIKNPLAGISGAIQVFAEDIPPNDTRREIIKEILREIDRLDQSIRNLLTFARPAALRLVKTDIIPVLERALRLISKQAEVQGVEIRMPAANSLVPVEVDPEQMQQVFLNIMLNALHSMPGGGILSIDANADDYGVRVSLTDTGMGISPDAYDNIFKPFFTTKHSGTGLGLAISKGIVERHGGSIEVDNRPGLGCTFRVIIPYQSLLNEHG